MWPSGACADASIESPSWVLDWDSSVNKLLHTRG
jgi:hypothetical protein